MLRRLLMAGLLLGIFGLLLLTYEPLLRHFASGFRVEHRIVESDAIVVMIGGLDRPARAAELYRLGLGPVILMGRDRVPGLTEAHRRVLLENGVPEQSIAILPGEVVKSTHDEAIRVRDYVEAHSVRRLTVVTTAYHTARTYWTLRKAFYGLSVDIRICPSDDLSFNESNWYMCKRGTKLYLLETMKTFYYQLAY